MVGLLDGAPPLPAEYVARAELAGLIRALLEPGNGALGLTGNVRALGLHGQGGIGKTVLAAALAHDERVRAHFPDGAFWVTMGERANLVATQLDLAARLGLPDAAVRSAHDGLQLLKETLACCWVLLVVDDVWSVAAATAFRATGPGGGAVHDAGPECASEGGRPGGVGRGAIRPSWRGSCSPYHRRLATALPAEADRVLAATGGRRWPSPWLGAAVRGGVSWAQAAAKLDRGGETFLDHPYANTFKALQLATGALAQQLGEAYLSLAVYPRDTRIPVAAVARYWRQLRDAPPEQTRAELQMLAGRELLTLDADEIAFHDLQHDYLLLRVDDLSLRHADLLAIYRALLPPDGSGEWWQLPRDEPYIWDHLIHHLSGAGNGAEIVATVTDLAYLTMRIALGGQHAAEDDLALALTHCSYQLPGDDRLLRPLLSRIRQSIDLLERCDSRESFCPTLAGRLQDAPELADFAAGASAVASKTASFTSRGRLTILTTAAWLDACRNEEPGIKALSWLAEPDRVGVAFRDGAVRLWEPSTHKLHQSMGPDLQRVTVAAWVNSRSLIAIGRSDGTVTVWPLPVGEGPGSLPDQGVAAVAWSKTGELAYAGWAGALARWSPRAGTQWLPPNIGGDRVTAMAWSDDGTQLAFGTVQGGVFSLSKDGPPQRLGEHPGGIASLTWSAEKRLAWAGGTEPSACSSPTGASPLYSPSRRTHAGRQSLHGTRMVISSASADSTVLSQSGRRRSTGPCCRRGPGRFVRWHGRRGRHC